MDVINLLNLIPEPFETIFSILFLVYLLGLLLQKVWAVWSRLLRPVAIRYRRLAGRRYIEDAIKNLTRRGVETPLGEKYKIKIKWTEGEGVELLPNDILIVAMPYTEDLDRAIAKALFLASPYFVSKYLATAVGEDLARALSINVVYRYVSNDLGVLSRLEKITEELQNNTELEKIVQLVRRADETSHYLHIFLPELREALERFSIVEMDKDKFRKETLTLLQLLANLHDVKDPHLRGTYFQLVIVRAGRLEKVALSLWEPYVEYIDAIRKRCRDLKKIYLVSAGVVSKKVARELVKFAKDKTGATSVREELYTAPLYKGKPHTPAYVAELVLPPP